jgi:hypothetical protein
MTDGLHIYFIFFCPQFSCVFPIIPLPAHGLPQSPATMLTTLPPELLYLILGFLDFYDALSLLSTHRSLQPTIQTFLRSNFAFHEAVYQRLLDFERRADDNDHLDAIANALLQLICEIVQPLPNYDHRAVFTEKLDIMQNLVVHRVLRIPNMEDDYARLCLKIRHIYLHAPSIRILHDPVSSEYVVI